MTSLSIWEKESYYATQDIVIVGAGLMGLWTAFELKKSRPSLSITILERNATPLGASTRNAGFACFGSVTELLNDAQQMGQDEMCRIVELRYKGIKKIRQHFSNATIDFDECGGYECISTNTNNLDEDIAWLNSLLKPITGNSADFKRVDNKLAPLGLKGFGALIENKSEAGLHSGHLVRALTQKTQALGVTILYGSPVTAWNKQKNYTDITCNDKRIKTNVLIFCTNAFTNELVDDVMIEPARGQVIVTSPIPDLLLKGTFHFDEGFYYWRNLGNRILLGGARNKAMDEEQTTDLSTSATIQHALETFLQTHIASQYSYTIEHRWGGVMGFSKNKQPIVQPIAENVFVAMACNGMGVALTPMIAEDAAALVLEKFN